MSEGGYVKIYRRLKDWEWYSDANTARVYLHILLSANHRTVRFKGANIKKGQCLLSVEKMAEALRMSRQSARTALQHLISTNEITTKPTKAGTLITVVNWDNYQADDCLDNRSPNQRGNRQLTRYQPDTNQILTTYQPDINQISTTNKNDKNDKNNIYTPLTPLEGEGASVQQQRFEQFWKEYPKKAAKQYALKAWMRIKPDKALFEKMLKALREQKQSEQWRRDNGKYIPNPATWLNGGYWDNEPEQPAARPVIQKQTSAHQYDERSGTDYSGVIIDLSAFDSGQEEK